MASIYLDNAATTPVDPLVKEAMLPYWEDTYGNPSSLHTWGKQAKQALDKARQTIAENLNSQPTELSFTSGGTEANNLAIIGLAQTLKSKGKHFITTCIEHPSILNPCQYLEAQGWEVTYLPVNSEGQIQIPDLEAVLRPETVLVSIMHGNNEIGTLQPIKELGQWLRSQGVLFHTDMIQTLGKLPLNLNELPIDYASLSAHKIYGPKGSGAFYCRQGAPQPTPLLWGGGQEANLRSGTENLAGIIGFAKAIKLAHQRMMDDIPRIQALQEQLILGIQECLPEAVLNGPESLEHRVAGNVHFSFAGVEGEALVLHLDLKGIAVSSGSACHSAQIEPSHVVLALGKSEALARGTVRFSIGRRTTETDIEQVLTVLPKVVHRLTPTRL